jgi:hypothetical protein
MKKNHKSFGFSQYFRKTVFAASFLGTVFVSDNMCAQVCSTNPAGTGYGPDIVNVTIGTLNNSSICNALGDPPSSIASQFNTYTATVAAPILATGISYPLSITIDDGCNDFFPIPGGFSWFYVWIDFNNNGDFNNPGELVYSSGGNNWNYPATTSPFITIPAASASVTAGIKRMRVVIADGSLSNACSFYFSGETEEYNVNIVASSPCSGAPATNSVVSASSTVCPNSGTSLFLANSYTNTGITYQWLSSSFSNVGPFTAVSGATTAYLSSPNLTTTTWFQLVASCVSVSTTAASAQVSVVPITTSSIPYFEGFENNNSALNKLPNCSWNRSIPEIKTTTVQGNFSWLNQTSRTGNGFVLFDDNNYLLCGSNTDYFLYSNGLQMFPGVTYSATVWYTGCATDNVSLMYGSNQAFSTAGLTALDTDNNPCTNTGVWVPLTNTFQVTSAGFYYMAVKFRDGCGRMSFDDLSVIIPCELGANAPSMVVNAPTFICEGQTANLSASGANSYSWASGPNTASYSPTPNITTTYSVTGSSTLTGCAVTIAKLVDVKLLPIVGIITPNNKVCAGSSISMNVNGGAYSYTWVNTGTTGAFLAATPSVSTNYTVIGTGPFGCVGSTTQSITVNPLPVITVAGNRTICVTGGAFTASGALTYQWSSNSFFLQGNSVNPNPQQNTNVTVSGTDQNGCVGTTVLALVVDPCTGIASLNGNGINNAIVYPNPSNGEFAIELKNGLNKTIELTDVTGRIVLTKATDLDLVHLNINGLSNGVYYVKIKSNNTTNTLKIVKQ